MPIYIYIYIYIKRERKRERERGVREMIMIRVMCGVRAGHVVFGQGGQGGQGVEVYRAVHVAAAVLQYRRQLAIVLLDIPMCSSRSSTGYHNNQYINIHAKCGSSFEGLRVIDQTCEYLVNIYHMMPNNG